MTAVKQKKERYKEDLRKHIMDAAKVLFKEEGYEATSIRKIASAIGYSPTTIYLYYKDKSEIIHALHTEGFNLLNSRFSVLAQVEDPFERLKAMGRIYMQFAVENSDFYEVMFIMKEPIAYLVNYCENEEWAEGSQAFYALLNTVEACMEQGYFTNQPPKQTAMLIWAFMHGLCAMKIVGHLDHIAKKKNILPEPEMVMEQTFLCFVQMIERTK
jgi:AcrR family transcriptional regulator